MAGPAFLVHHVGDHVGVAVRDLSAGEARGETLDDQSTVEVTVTEDVQLGHKVALQDLTAGEDVIEYGLRIGIASADISKGQHVHTHNVRSARWQNSVA
jgi:(2R)-sulfolactate sulfo-lyase subunit alpha